jgi:hypothetical protein
MRAKVVSRPIRSAGRGMVRVEEDAQGHQWVVCTGCRRREYAPGVTPAKFAQRKHAESCGT